MQFNSEVAAIRFGFGLSPLSELPLSLDKLVSGLTPPTKLERDFPLMSLRVGRNKLFKYRELTQAAQKGDKIAQNERKKFQREDRLNTAEQLKSIVGRAIFNPNGFQERLSVFWTDHFTVSAQNRVNRAVLPDMIQTAIRPNLGGKFGDMLTAVMTHPAMLIYLGQAQSFGPNSRAGQRSKKGLNENLARELLELHTIGVDGAYTQKDVRELAELLTGLSVNKSGFIFRPSAAEPGSETVLGKTYGGGQPSLSDIKTMLEDLALNPDTAKHISTKLAHHFISPDPDPEMISTMAAAYLETGGDLSQTYRAMLSHKSAWDPNFSKIKQPFDYVVSGLRAFALPQKLLQSARPQDFASQIAQPMQLMGQPMLRPRGPDGWKEENEAWITPVALSGRVQWALQMGVLFERDKDPNLFAQDAMGSLLSPELALVVSRAETRAEAIALVLASPEFNRR